MESNTERSDKLEKDVENICHPMENVPYSSCYESQMEEERLRCEARELQDRREVYGKSLKKLLKKVSLFPMERY